MNIRKEVCLIVDAYSTANKLAGVINAYGYPCVHIQSNSFIPEVLQRSFRPCDFIDNFVCDKTPESLHHQILERKYEIKCVITGAESGVLLSDYLANKFNVPGNDVNSSTSRRNKYEMTETLKSNSLNHIRQIKTQSIEEVYKWVRENKINPVVLKPLLSSGTNGFHICHSESDIERAFKSLYQSKDVFGNINHEILVQEYIEGQEYCVNMVSYEGKHCLSEIWKTDKQISKHSKVYDLETLLTEDNEHFSILFEYAKEVLRVLKISYGPSHLEIFVQSDGTPVLVEAAARFMGAMELALITKAYGTNAILLTAEAYLKTDSFIKNLQAPRPKIMKYPAMVQLISSQEKEGILKEWCFDQLKHLKTFHGIDVYMKSGGHIQQTIDSGSALGLVYLVGDSMDEILSDYSLIRSMEKRGEIYTIQPLSKEN